MRTSPQADPTVSKGSEIVGRRWAAIVLMFVASLAGAQRPLVITDVTVISVDGDPRSTADQTIVVRDGRIESVGPSDTVKRPRRAQTIDGSELFAIAGLTDAHVHIKRSRSDLDRLLPLFLAHGVTTVINLDGGSSVLRLRDEIDRGERLGPKVVTSGPIIRGHEGMTAEDGRTVALDQIEAGYDLIKVYNGIPGPAYLSIIQAARERDVPVIGHAVRSVGLDGVIEAGQHLAHMEEVVYGYFTWPQRSSRPADLPNEIGPRLDALLDSELIAPLAERVAEAKLFVTPNLTAYHNIVLQLEDLDRSLARPEVALMPASMTRFWQRDRNDYLSRPNLPRFLAGVSRTFPFLQELTKAFDAAGVALLAGTDVGIPVIVAGTSQHDELEELVTAGISPGSALAAATTAPAAFLGRSDSGRIEAGMVADLVLLRANPLVDITKTRAIEAVVVRGRAFERNDLDDLVRFD